VTAELLQCTWNNSRQKQIISGRKDRTCHLCYWPLGKTLSCL